MAQAPPVISIAAMCEFFFAAALAAGTLASLVGLGIGSILTPLLSLLVGVGLAVAAVALPRFVSTAVSFWSVRRDVDRRVLLSIGLPTAAGGPRRRSAALIAENVVLTVVFGGLPRACGSHRTVRRRGTVMPRRRGAWQGDELAKISPLIEAMIAAVVVGTFVGLWLAGPFPERAFRSRFERQCS